MKKDAANCLDVVLVVEDEEAVLRTFQEWLSQGNLGVELLTAADAETALRLAAVNKIDLAILDWNLGSGINGLDLLEDLALFHPGLTAILVTGYANQATPLHAMRMGVRDYLDKNQELTRETFLAAVKKQLDWIRPVKRQRNFFEALKAFRDNVGQAVSWMDSSHALVEETRSKEVIGHLLNALLSLAGGKEAFLLMDNSDSSEEKPLCFGREGIPRSEAVPFSNSFAGQALGMGKRIYSLRIDATSSNPLFTLQEFEKGHAHALFLPLSLEGIRGVVEILDPGALNEQEKQALEQGALLGADALRLVGKLEKSEAVILEALKQAERITLEAELGSAAPGAGKVIENALAQSGVSRAEIDFLEMVRHLSRDHGQEALNACGEMVRAVRKLLSGNSEVPGE
ncbi:MAG: response regulator [Gemmataceae bacterium]|nr:response regulator [Gemmataceae bacterium]